jgi:hypothetical protein
LTISFCVYILAHIIVIYYKNIFILYQIISLWVFWMLVLLRTIFTENKRCVQTQERTPAGIVDGRFLRTAEPPNRRAAAASSKLAAVCAPPLLHTLTRTHAWLARSPRKDPTITIIGPKKLSKTTGGYYRNVLKHTRTAPEDFKKSQLKLLPNQFPEGPLD